MRRGFKRDDGKLLFNARADGIVDYQEYLEITERPPIHLLRIFPDVRFLIDFFCPHFIESGTIS
jgi:hypothetical protein